MELVIGGAFQGKRKEACRLFSLEETQLIDGSTCDLQEIYRCRAIFHFHEYVRRSLKEERTVEKLVSGLLEKNADIVIISDEIGYGIVPLDAFERLWREQTGRVCCQIAGQAAHVIRVVAGIATVIKGTKI